MDAGLHAASKMVRAYQTDPHNPSTDAVEAMKKQESLHTTATTYPIEGCPP
jgi:hypothetical protein